MVQVIQEFLNLSTNANLTVDGIQGNKTNQAIRDFVTQLRKTFTRLGYNYSPTYNIIGYRTDDVYTDRFTDYLILETAGTILVWRFSTKPGQVSVLKNINLWVNGRNGVACLKEGQYLQSYKLNTGWWSGRPFFQQILPVTIYRDNNTNNILDRNSVQQVGLFGINLHTWIGFRLRVVGNLSEGCQVADEINWLDFLGKLVDQDGIVDYTLLHDKQFKGDGKY